ncbi:MAG: ATP-binding response regulator, partial [Acidimicrobiales bacterium]
SNATKYTGRGRVSVTVDVADDGAARIAVGDTGPGIRPEHLDRVFEPFDRLGAEQSGVEGTGVGLTLSKHLVERMGGLMEVASEVGVGSVFSVLLPPAPPPDDSGELCTAPVAPPALSGTLRILHIEDNPDNLALVEQILARHPQIELLAAGAGAPGLALARRHRPDVILLDLHLPDMSGHEVLDRLRADPATSDTAVVVVSADATVAAMAALDGQRVAAYLTKPIDVRELLWVIDSLTRHLGDIGDIGGPGDLDGIAGASADGDPS